MIWIPNTEYFLFTLSYADFKGDKNNQKGPGNDLEDNKNNLSAKKYDVKGPKKDLYANGNDLVRKNWKLIASKTFLETK